MTEEEIFDCVLEIDEFLRRAEIALESRDTHAALVRVKEARAAIEDLREDDESDIDSNEQIGTDVMNSLK